MGLSDKISDLFVPGDHRYFFNEFLLNKMLISHIIQDFAKRVKAFKFLRPVDRLYAGLIQKMPII